MSGSKSSDASFAHAASLPPDAPQGAHPLGLTVHSLPPAGGAMAAVQQSRQGRWKMLGILLVCAAPVVASYFTYYVLRPEGRRNFGELIAPSARCRRAWRPPPSMALPVGSTSCRASGCS